MNNLAYLGPETGPFSLKRKHFVVTYCQLLAPVGRPLFNLVKANSRSFLEAFQSNYWLPKDLGTNFYNPNYFWKSIDVSGSLLVSPTSSRRAWPSPSLGGPVRRPSRHLTFVSSQLW